MWPALVGAWVPKAVDRSVTALYTEFNGQVWGLPAGSIPSHVDATPPQQRYIHLALVLHLSSSTAISVSGHMVFGDCLTPVSSSKSVATLCRSWITRANHMAPNRLAAQMTSVRLAVGSITSLALARFHIRGGLGGAPSSMWEVQSSCQECMRT